MQAMNNVKVCLAC